MTSAEWDKLQADISTVGAAWADSSYYADAEKWTFIFWDAGAPFRSLFDQLDLTSIVELACGHGRHAMQIVEDADRIILIDIFDNNLDVCRRRFEGRRHIEFIKGDGCTFAPLPDATVSAIFCYDAMVHFSASIVASYLTDAARVLQPGGKALFHHSNYSVRNDDHYGENPHARNYMTTELFNELSAAAGLTVLEQKVISWGLEPDLDCITLLQKDPM